MQLRPRPTFRHVMSGWVHVFASRRGVMGMQRDCTFHLWIYSWARPRHCLGLEYSLELRLSANVYLTYRLRTHHIGMIFSPSPFCIGVRLRTLPGQTVPEEIAHQKLSGPTYTFCIRYGQGQESLTYRSFQTDSEIAAVDDNLVRMAHCRQP